MSDNKNPQIKQMYKRFAHDKAVGMPFHQNDDSDPVRKEYIDKLLRNEDFVTTYKANDEKFQDSARNILKFKKLNRLDIVIFVAAILSIGTIGGACKNSKYNEKTPITQRIPGVAFWAFIGALSGLLFASVTTVSTKRVERETGVEDFYNRMIVRLLNVLRKKYPDLDENVLRSCNPEMARVIKAIMITNMSESDTRKIQEIAMKLYDTKYPNTLTVEEMRDIDKAISTAINIVTNTLVKHPELNNIIIDAYRGKIPVKFALQQNQNEK